MLKFRNFGRKSLRELEDVLQALLDRFIKISGESRDLEDLRDSSYRASEQTTVWSRQNHAHLQQVLAELESKDRQHRNLMTLLLKSAVHHRCGDASGVLIPYELYNRLSDDCHDIVDRFYCQDIVDSHRNWMQIMTADS